MILSIKTGGALFLDEYPTALADPGTVLKHAVALPEKQLFLRAGKQAPYGTVMEAMGHARAAGISDLATMAESLPGPGPGGDCQARGGLEPAMGSAAR